MRNKRRLLNLGLAGVLLLSIPLGTFAANVNEEQQKKNNLESDVQNADSNIGKLERQKQAAESSITALDSELESLMAKMQELKKDMQEKEVEIETTKVELEEAQKEEEKQYDDMKKRIKYMYENGNSTFLTLLLGADSISDFLNKAEYISSISTYDREMLQRYQEVKELVEKKEEQLKKEYKEQEELEKDLANKSSSTEALIEKKSAEVDTYINQIGAESARAAQLRQDLESQQSLVNELVAEESRLAREAEQEAEEKPSEAAQKDEKSTTASSNKKPNSSSGNGSGSSGSGGSTGSGSANKGNSGNTGSSAGGGSTSGGGGTGGSGNGGGSSSGNGGSSSGNSSNSSGLSDPCPGRARISDEFGYRYHPISGTYKMHNGIDLAAPQGTPIYAAGAGTVSSGYNSSMGNYIKINHGNGMTTVYMHCNSLYVKSGSVSKGTLIAGVGTTGASTGNHLHFEVHVNGVAKNPRNYVSF